ncbi:MAG TPA: Smr/MutS family protein [Anaeromyxobacteraceae bacterium]|nr:Smr/MutS family protein [Anaeromyxobacteraceae bacterium]
MTKTPDASLVHLGWPEVTTALAARCRLPAGRRHAASLPFLSTPAEVRESLARVEEARALAEARLTLPLGMSGAAEDHLDRAAKGGVLEPVALRECASLLRAAARTRTFLEVRAERSPLLWTVGQALSGDERLADRIERAIEPSGTISDRASPELAGLRDRVRGLHRALKAQVESMLADEHVQMHLRDRYFTIRDDRYVLPILASSRSQFPGIVHNASQSGQTLFVEPDSMVDAGNELTIATAMAAEEEARILRELSEGVARRAPELAADVEILGRLDLFEAEARLASELDAHAPDVAPSDAGFELLSLRHPILVLQGKKVVASHVRLEPPQRALIVSGPNGGGKTVTISAVGLAACLLRAGLPVPAAQGSRLPLYAEVRAAVDEKGDLARDLSTFTAHLTAVRDIAFGAGSRSLVLVDEIAADTDPREGAALAAAILEDLLERGAQVLVTTHLDELKALALTDPRYANARVGFDPERLAPTYQLHLGSPGSSSALEVARRVGLPEKVVERARQAMTGQGGALAQALRALEEERARLAVERRGMEAARAAAAAMEERARAAEERSRRAEREAAARMGEALAGELDAARDEVARVLADLQAAPTVRKATETQKQLEAWRATVSQATRSADAQARAGPEAVVGGEVARGTRVRIVSLGQEAEVLEVDGDEALLRAGPLKVRRPVSDLLPLRGKATSAPGFAKTRRERLAAAEEAAPAAVRAGERRLDVRGLRVEELLREVDRFLDGLYADGAPDAVILHGHGTGALKQALRDHLGASPYVASFRAGDRHEGGDATTVVVLRR